MGIIYLPLILSAPVRSDGTRRDIPPLPPGVSARIDEGSRILSEGLRMGEALGLDVSELTQRLREVESAPPQRGGGLFLEEDMALLHESYTRIHAGLREAITDAGLPRGEAGARLVAAPGIGQYSDGGLFSSFRGVPLADVLEWLEQLCRFLAFAQENQLLMRKGELPPPDEEEPD
jgi:hypothetical protein